MTINLQSCMKFSLRFFYNRSLEHYRLQWLIAKEKKKKGKKGLWHYNDGVPRSMCFSLGIGICMCPVLSGSMMDMIQRTPR